MMERVKLGRTGLEVSAVGFGGYRISTGNPPHREALREALHSGCNLIDTSANYMDGGSETLIGEVLRELFAEGRLARQDVVVVSKAGYVQGSNLGLARRRESEGKPFPGMVKYQQGIWHCISPEFLEDQLTRSLKRLGLERLDVFLLHNPEYFLKHAVEKGADLEASREEYYSGLREAFAWLEREAERGRIGWYGVSSNTFVESEDAEDFTSLDRVLAAAREAAGGREPRFGVIQFPLNLFERGGALTPNNGGRTVLETAWAEGLGTLINRPLNAFNGRRMVRLADFGHFDPGSTESVWREKASEAVARAREVEDGALKGVPIEKMAWARAMEESFHQVDDLLTWQDVLGWRILPSLEQHADRLAAHADPAVREWHGRYERATVEMLNAVTRWLEFRTGEVSRRISGQLDEAAPELSGEATLSRKCIRLYRSLPGLNCVLVGMRRTEYVRDALGAGPSIEGARALEALRKLDADWS